MKEKVSNGCDISSYFPSYRGKPKDVAQVKDFIQGMYEDEWEKYRSTVSGEFSDENSISSNRSKLYCEFTCATDTNQVEVVVDNTKQIFLNGALSVSGLAYE